MDNNTSKGVRLGFINKIGKYLPILVILLSITILIGSTFAYFTDKTEEASSLTFSKVELSNETTTGINGVLKDVIPGSPLISSPVKFSKSIDSEPIYVRAKLSFTLDEKYKNDEKMNTLLDGIKSSTDFNIYTQVQNNAVWSAKQDNYFYLVNSDDATILKIVDTVDTYILSNEIVVPRDLKQLEDNYQYMNSINFNLSFEAIQADNVSGVLSEAKGVFNSVFPPRADEMGDGASESTITVTILDADFGIDEVITLNGAQVIQEPNMETPQDENGNSLKAFAGWYFDENFENKVDFTQEITESVTLYPKLLNVSAGLTFTALYEDTANSSVITSYTVAKGTCTDKVVVIPEYYNGKPVTQVRASGFTTYKVMTNIIFPNTITKIHNLAFQNCTNLVVDSLPSELVQIGNYAFQNCKFADNITIPKTLTTIGTNPFVGCKSISVEEGNPVFYIDGNCLMNQNTKTLITGTNQGVIPDDTKIIAGNAFHGCKTIESITIPSGVTTLGTYAFYDCVLLREINFNATLMNVLSNNNYVFGNAGNTSGSITLNIGSNVTRLPAYIFYPRATQASYAPKITNVVFQENSVCERINKFAFAYCQALEAIALPDSITILEEQVFYYCTNLKLVQLSNNITNIASNTFYSCSSLETVGMPSNLTKIAVNAFAECRSLKDIELPNTITTLENLVFSNCVSLESVNIPNQLTAIPNSLFNGCESLTSVGNLPSGLTSIGQYAFSNCTSLTNIVLPDSVENIGQNAFYGCSSLASINIPQALISFSTNAFYDCTSLVEINYDAIACSDLSSGNYVFFNAGANASGIQLNIGSSVTMLPNYVFNPYNSSGQPKITSIVFEESSNCRSIGQYAFYNCTNLTAIELPSSVTTLGQYAFYNCSGVTSIEYNAASLNNLTSSSNVFTNLGSNSDGVAVVIGNNVTKIPEYIFYSVTQIKSVAFEENSTCATIGAYAFQGCTGLSEITIPSCVTSMGASAFRQCSNVEVINYNATKVTTSNSVFTSSGKDCVVNVASNVSVIPGYLFNSSNIVNVIFANNSECVTIGDYAFNSCTKLVSINLPNTITSIGTYAFVSTGKIADFALPANLETIGARAFYYSNYTTSLTIPSSVKTIGALAFDSWVDLTEINFNAENLADFNTNGRIFENAGTSGSGVVVNIGKDVTKIPAYLFYYSSKAPNVTSIIFDDNCKCSSIGDYAFYTLKNVTNMKFTLESMTDLTMGNNVFFSIGVDGAGVTLTIGKNVKKLPAYLFYGQSSNNPNITSVIFEEGSVCESIAVGAFAYCNKLKMIKLPSSITSITNGAFSGQLTYILCETEEVANLVKGKISYNKYIYSLQDSVDGALVFTDTVVNGVTIGTAKDGSNFGWVKVGTDDYKYYKAIVAG